jgi:hypothetical protein
MKIDSDECFSSGIENTCLEECPEGGCVIEEYSTYL